MEEKQNNESTTALAALESMDQIPQYLKIVEDKIAELTKGRNQGPKTTGNLEGYGKIDEIKTVRDLIRARASVILKADAYEESAKAMGISLQKYPCIISGHSPSSWIKDIEARAEYLKHKDELDKLKQIKAKLEANLSQKEKFKRDMADIANLLTN